MYLPKLDGAESKLVDICNTRVIELYGEQILPTIEQRMDTELDIIQKNGYSVMFMIAYELSAKSREVGYPVSTRGGVGSSFVAYLAGITDINPLPAHYRCPDCKTVEFPIQSSNFAQIYHCGADLPYKTCPDCGSTYINDGFNISFETFMGIDGEIVPDIDLDVAEGFFVQAFDVLKNLFPNDVIIRAGSRNRRGEAFVHPSGWFVIPKEYADNVPTIQIQHDGKSQIITEQDYHELLDDYLKVDFTNNRNLDKMKRLSEASGIDINNIPLDDNKTLAIMVSGGISCISWFETEYARNVFNCIKPNDFTDFVRISGLLHGSSTWEGNAEIAIKSGLATLYEVIAFRDDIMLYLMSKGICRETSYEIMENVRKKRWLSNEYVTAMKEANVPEWYVDTCRKLSITFLAPKAHCVSYTLMSYRLAWFKAHCPDAFAEAVS